GLTSADRSSFDTWRSLTNSPTLPWPDSDSSTDLRNKLFLVTTMATLSRRRFRSSWIWDERTLVRSAAAMTGYFSNRTCSSAIASFFQAATFRVVDMSYAVVRGIFTRGPIEALIETALMFLGPFSSFASNREITVWMFCTRTSSAMSSVPTLTWITG